MTLATFAACGSKWQLAADLYSPEEMFVIQVASLLVQLDTDKCILLTSCF